MSTWSLVPGYPGFIPSQTRLRYNPGCTPRIQDQCLTPSVPLLDIWILLRIILRILCRIKETKEYRTLWVTGGSLTWTTTILQPPELPHLPRSMLTLIRTWNILNKRRMLLITHCMESHMTSFSHTEDAYQNLQDVILIVRWIIMDELESVIKVLHIQNGNKKTWKMFDKVPLYKYVLVLKTGNFIEHCTRPVAILCAETLTLVLTITKVLAFVNLVKWLY